MKQLCRSKRQKLNIHGRNTHIIFIFISMNVHGSATCALSCFNGHKPYVHTWMGFAIWSQVGVGFWVSLFLFWRFLFLFWRSILFGCFRQPSDHKKCSHMCHRCVGEAVIFCTYRLNKVWGKHNAVLTALQLVFSPNVTNVCANFVETGQFLRGSAI